MYLAHNEQGGAITPTPGARATCPTCGETVIAKTGEINAWHWAHQSLTDCDPWSEHETQWHHQWKNQAMQSPFFSIEKTITKNGKQHRADIVTPRGTVVELQHSSISPDEIWTREQFYNDMAWVFDLTDLSIIDRRSLPILPYGGRATTNARFTYVRKPNGRYKFRFKTPRKTIFTARKQVFLDTQHGMFYVTHAHQEGRYGAGNLITHRAFLDALKDS